MQENKASADELISLIILGIEEGKETNLGMLKVQIMLNGF